MSSAVEQDKLPSFSNTALEYGRAHYSWKIVHRLYESGLQAGGIDVLDIIRPEIYNTPLAKKVLGLSDSDFHICVKPIEHIRSLPYAYNIYVSGWEFPEFSELSYENNPLLNHISMLKHADQIWCWSNFTRTNLASYGINNTVTNPPPVMIDRVATEGALDHIAALRLDTERDFVFEDLENFGTVLKANYHKRKFLAIFNPFDMRKQIGSMLTAFSEVSQDRDDIILYIKLVIDNKVTTLPNIQEIVRVMHSVKAKSDKIVFIGDTLSEGQIAELMSSVDFYLCTSSTEGLNLPLIEAMGKGVVPISTNATAMADYINSQNAIVMKYDKLPTEGPYHGMVQHLQTTHFPPQLSSLRKAIGRAADLSEPRYRKLSSASKRTAEDGYSMSAFLRRLSGSVLA